MKCSCVMLCYVMFCQLRVVGTTTHNIFCLNLHTIHSVRKKEER